MFAEWPPPHTEMNVFVKQIDLPGTYPAAFRLDDYCWGGGIEPLLHRNALNGILRSIAALSPRDRKNLDWTARWLPDEPTTLEVHHQLDRTIEHLRPQESGQYHFTEEYGFHLTDDLPPIAEFLTARARLRADRDGQDVFDSTDERHIAAQRAINAIGTAAREIIELALVGLDDADRVKDHALLMRALTRAAAPDDLEAWRRKDTK